ncbi:MAG: thiamine pyrophosphate-dependent enzyme [Terriglobia bacterium]|jgi:pyruvate/2-oxoacid:ferredoxin oxidoreductase beta subunit/Pyruvate/2-oxoacid:ferredoxin oxidoreductase gamma subunit
MEAGQYLDPNAKLPYCRGCGHAAVVRQLSRALERLQLSARSVALTTDIGCVGLADSLFPYLHTVHTTHGRSTAFATGLALAEVLFEHSGLKPVVMIGDGGAMIGLLHLVHAAQLNVDVTVLVHNNFLFGMTGGQHSALTPLEFVTATTPEGNYTPPLDLLALLRAAHAGFLARQYATDSDLDAVIAEAIAFPGFALVEILELCTAYGTRWNELTGSTLKEMTHLQGYAIGKLETNLDRATFRDVFRHEQHDSHPPQAGKAESAQRVEGAALAEELRLVVAGSAGERVQSSAALLTQAALACGLYVTQKNDNPVTQGSGFSLAEVCLSPRPIEYTGMEQPDVIIIASAEGLKELQANGTLGRCRAETLVILDAELEAPTLPGRVIRLPLRKNATPARAAMAGIAAWLALSPVIPAAAWEIVLAGAPEARRAESKAALEVGKELAAAWVP